MLWSGADLYYCFALRGRSLNFPICMLHISTNQQLFDNQHSPLYLNRHMKKGSSRKVRETNREEPNEHKEETVISVAISKALGNFNLVIESLKFTC